MPKAYGIFEPKVLEDLIRLFNSEQIKQATGDVFGRIYEYFLAKFSIQKAHDNGEFPRSCLRVRGRAGSKTMPWSSAKTKCCFDTLKKLASDVLTELRDASTLYEGDAKKLLASLSAFEKKYDKSLPDNNAGQRTARETFEPTAEAIRGIVKQVDLLYKLAARVGDLGNELASDEAVAAVYDRRAASRLVKQLDEERKTAVEQLKHVVYFHRQVAWLQDRFPKAELQNVPGLVKLVDLNEIEAVDWRRVQCSARKEGLMFKTVFAATAALVITAIPAQAQTCTRDGLKAIVANYFRAVETHNMSALETAPNLRITQNGSEIKLGEGFFKTGGKSRFQRTLIDTERCGTLTQAVIDETPDPNAPAPAGRGGARGAAGPRGAAPGGAAGAGQAGPRQGGPGGALAGPRGGAQSAAADTGPAVIFAVRLKVDEGRVSEIETIVNRQGELFFSPAGVLETKDHDWEGILPPAQRSTREYMNDAANKYFSGFSLNPEVEAPFATPCDRWEGGVSTTATTHNCSAKGFNMTHTHRRFPVTDVEAGIAAGFVNFNGGLPDVHMFKIRNGKIEMIQAVFGGNAQGAIWPDETK